MTDNGNDSSMTLSERYGLKRYLEISSGSRFLDDIRIGETDASRFRMVFPPETAQAIARDGMDPIAAIVLRTAMVFCSSWGIDFDGMQIGFTNDPERDEPLWERDSEHPDRYRLTLCAQSPDHWCQVIYQIGYLFTHCVLEHNSARSGIPWVDETICETMSLYLLSDFAAHWKACGLSVQDPDYADSIREYIRDFMTEQDWTDRPARCASLKELLAMNDGAAKHSGDRVGTVIRLYSLMTPVSVRNLLVYRLYLIDDLPLIDTGAWLDAYPNDLAVRCVASLQDNAVREDPEYLAIEGAYRQKEDKMQEEFWESFWDDDWTDIDLSTGKKIEDDD